MMLSVLFAAHALIATQPSIEIDNHAVEVIRIRMSPHQKIPMHEVTSRVVVFLTDAHLRLTFPDGKVREERWSKGQTGWLDRQSHAGENLGDEPIEFIAVIPKGH
jgi:quercetin dioxygenase-like cupin family protein